MDWKTLVGLTLLFHAIVYVIRREWILRLDTRKLNGPINSIGTHPIRKYFRLWFRLGTYATIILGFPFTVFLFLRTIYYAVAPSVVSVAVAVTTPRPSSDSVPELHHEREGPYPDADLGVTNNESVSPGEDGGGGYLAIQPLLPGWNLPVAHLPYYLLAILISVVIHELGHAVASAAHKVPIQSVGVSIFGPLIPAAHVELNSCQLRESPVKKQLDILTAGVWMNLYLALITYFVVPKMLPALLWPTHSMGTGLTVTGVWPNSGIGGPGGLVPGDVIIGIENCPVRDLDSWYTCLEVIWGSDPLGYCVPNEVLEKYANNTEGCCGTGSDDSETHLCFLQMDHQNNNSILMDKALPPPQPPPIPESQTQTNNSLSDAPLPPQANEEKEKPKGEGAERELHPNTNTPHSIPPPKEGHHNDDSSHFNNHSTYCLPAQIVVAESSPLTTPQNYKEGDTLQGWEGRCSSPTYRCGNPKDSNDSNHHCFMPRLVKDLRRFRIVQIQRRSSDPVLFVGNLGDLYQGMRNSEYVPRIPFWPSLAKFPEKLETVLLLTAGLSAGLAVVNMLPIYGLDGYHMVDAVARSYFGKWDPREISRLVQWVSWAAMGVAALTVVSSVAQFI